MEITINYYQAVHVAKVVTNLAPYATISGALTAITDNSATKRYAVYVHPGTYTEQITMKPYIDLIAAGGREETIIYHECTGDHQATVTGENSMIKGFTIQSYGGAASAFMTRCVNAGTAGFEIEDCILEPSNPHADAITLNATASCDIRDCVVDNAGAATTGALFTTAAQTYNVSGTTFNAATDAIQVTLAITALNLTDCTVSDHFNQDGGTVNVVRSHMEAVTLGTADCTFGAEFTQFTGAFATVADANEHNIDLSKCDFSNGAGAGNTFTSAATGTGSTIDMWDCDGITTLTNSDAGTINLHNCSIDTLTTSAGIVDAFGGSIRACGGSTGTRFTWRLDDANFRVLASMVIQDALGQASAGDVIHLDAVRYTETITLVDGVHIEGATSDTDTPSEIYWDSDATAVVTAGAVESSMRRVKIFQHNAGGTAYALSVTGAAVVAFSHCAFECDAATQAIHMINGNLSLDECNILDGDINLSTATCILTLDHCTLAGPAGNADLEAAGGATVNHEITCLHTDFGANSVNNASTGDTILVFKYCSDITNFTDAGTNAAAGEETIIENTIIGGTALKSGTTPWYVRLARIGILSNTGASASITIAGGYVGSVAASDSPIVWNEPESNEFRVITGMKIQDALNAATSTTVNDTIHIGPGIFTEALAIGTGDSTVPVTLQGDGRGVTIIRQTNETPLTITDEDGVVVRDLSIEVTAADGDEGILCHNNNTGNDLTLTLYNVLIDIDATGATTDYGIRLYRTTSGTFALVMTQCEIDVHNTAVAGAQVTYGVSLEAGDGALTKSEFRESYISSTCDAAGTEYGIYISTVACDLDVYSSVILDGGVYIFADNLAHDLIFVNCDLHGGGIDSNAAGLASTTTLDMRGCSNVGKLTNDGIGDWTVRDSDVQDCETTDATVNAGHITIFGGDVGTCAGASADGDIVWWKDTNLIYVMPSMLLAHAIAAAGATGDTIRLGQGTWAESNLVVEKSINFIGEGLEESLISTGDNTDPILQIGDAADATAVTCTIQGLTIQNTGTQEAIELVSGTEITTVVVRECYIDGGSAAVALAAAGAGVKTFEAFETALFADTTCIDVDCTAAVADIDIHNCEITGGAFANLTGANHDFDVWDTECGGGTITAAGNDPTIDLTRCNDVGAITNRGGALVIEHCTTGAVSTIAGGVTIEQSNIGKLSASDAATVNVYNSYITEAEPAAGTFSFYECYLVDIDANGGTVTVYGGTIEGVSDSSNPVRWLVTDDTYRVITGMKIQHAIDHGTAGKTILIGPGTFTEALSFAEATDEATLIGEGTDKTIIYQSNGTPVTLAPSAAWAGALCIENLTIQGAAMDNDYLVHVNSATAAASLVMWNVKLTGARTANNAYGVYTSGGEDSAVELRNCVVTMTGAATTYGVYAFTSGANTYSITMENCYIDGAIDDLNIADDCTVTSYYCTYATGGITLASDTECVLHCYRDTILGTITKGADAVMWYKASVQVYEVWNGMEIGDAITAATNETPTDTFRFTVKVHEGEYSEAVTMAQFIDLVGDSSESCVIYQSGANVIAAAADSRIRNVRVELLAGSDDSAIYVNNVTGVVIEECTITVARTSGNNSGILTAGSGGAEVYRCSIEATAAEDAAIVCQGTGATELYNNDLNGGLADINLNADVDGDLQTYNNNCRGAGFRIVAVDTYNVYAHGDVFKTVTHLLAAGVRGHMFLQNEPNIALVREGMYITDGIALATADTPGVANPWKVQVGPGVYTEQITMDGYVNVIGEGGYEVTSIFHECAAADDEATVTMESNCRLEGFTIISDGNGDTYEARCITSDAKSDWLIKDCLFSHVDSSGVGGADNQCVFIDTSGTGLRLEHCRWRSGTIAAPTTDDIKRALQVDADGIEVLLQDCETYSDTTAATDSDFFLNEGKVETRNCMIRGGGWYISDNATSIGISWDDDWQGTKVIQVTFAGTSGQFADLSGARLYTCAVTETLGEAVYISNPDTVDEATNTATPAEGIIVYKPSDVLCYVKKHGYVYLADPATLIGVAFTAGGNIWLGATGAWLAAAPSNAIKQILGVAKGPGDGAAAKEFLINISLTNAGTAVKWLNIPIAWGAGTAPTGTHVDGNSRRAVAIVGAAGQTVFSQAVAIPEDFLTFSKLYVTVFPTGGGSFDWTAYSSAASSGQDEATHSQTATADTVNVVDDRILDHDISAALDYVMVEQDKLSIELIVDVLTIITQLNVLGFKLEYVSQYGS